MFVVGISSKSVGVEMAKEKTVVDITQFLILVMSFASCCNGLASDLNGKLLQCLHVGRVKTLSRRQCWLVLKRVETRTRNSMKNQIEAVIVLLQLMGEVL